MPAKAKRGPGRPRSADRVVQHSVWVSTEADALLRAAAEAEGITLVEWWRRALGAGLMRTAEAVRR